jgi:hypothetical protein
MHKLMLSLATFGLIVAPIWVAAHEGHKHTVMFVDLHMGDLAGPIVPMSCAWSGDQTTLVCTLVVAAAARDTYMVHVGGGMVDVNG